MPWVFRGRKRLERMGCWILGCNTTIPNLDDTAEWQYEYCRRCGVDQEPYTIRGRILSKCRMRGHKFVHWFGVVNPKEEYWTCNVCGVSTYVKPKKVWLS